MIQVVRTSCKTPHKSGGYKRTNEEAGSPLPVSAWGGSAISGMKLGLHRLPSPHTIWGTLCRCFMHDTNYGLLRLIRLEFEL